MSDQKILLEVAWRWKCPTCAQRNYVGGQLVNDQEMLQEAQMELGEGVLCSQPEVVYCNKCGNDFETSDGEES